MPGCDVPCVDPGIMFFQVRIHPRMKIVDLLAREPPAGDTALVRDHDHFVPVLVHPTDGLDRAVAPGPFFGQMHEVVVDIQGAVAI